MRAHAHVHATFISHSCIMALLHPYYLRQEPLCPYMCPHEVAPISCPVMSVTSSATNRHLQAHRTPQDACLYNYIFITPDFCILCALSLLVAMRSHFTARIALARWQMGSHQQSAQKLNCW